MAADLRRVGQQNILRLQVAVHNTLLVEILKTSNHLSNDDSRVELINFVVMSMKESP